MSLETLLAHDFATISELLSVHARLRPAYVALSADGRELTFFALDRLLDRCAAALQRDGVRPGEVIAIGAATSIEYTLAFLGALRAGVAVAPLAPSATGASLAAMLQDCGARHLFLDAAFASTLDVDAPEQDDEASASPRPAIRVALDGSSAGTAFERWLAPEDARPHAVQVAPGDAFNIIYSSGTTGTPKGIVQSHLMRWSHVRRGGDSGYGPDAVTLISTPLYSNTTLVSFFPGLSLGGKVVLLEKFDPERFLAAAQRHRATHAMLVPVQYQRLLDDPAFDRFDLSSFRLKFCTSAPFPAALKARVLARWPGGLVEYYGMTEGGGSCALAAHEFPHKLHTVGKPLPEHDVRLIDDEGNEVAPGEPGEIVGNSPLAMMTGYHNHPDQTRAAEWRNPDGKRFIRTGDIGRFDADGFLILLDRKKDMVISGGFNVYPSDLEAVLRAHPAVADAAVVGVPSPRWGETPLACVVLKPEQDATTEEIRAWVNTRVGKTQRLHAVELLDALPRSAIGKVLKRELRERYARAGEDVP